MNISTLDTNQKLGVIATVLLAVFIVLYTLFIAPVIDKNTQLQAQIDKATQLSQYLNEAQKEMVNLPYFPSLTTVQAKTIIKSIFKRQRINLRQSTVSNNTIKYLFNKIEFDQLLKSFKTLKSKHGITVSSASINRVDSGNVNGEVTLVFVKQ